MIAEQHKPSRVLVGTVISAGKMQKTAVVKVARTYIHPRLQKVMRTARTYKVHDEHGQVKMGDVVEIYEGRPLSKTKYMYLHRVVGG